MDRQLETSLRRLVKQGSGAASLLIYKNSKLTYYKTTNPKFEDAYMNSQPQVVNCHIAEIATRRINEGRPYTLIWDQLIPTNEDSLFLNELRLEHNYCHGITILNPINDTLLIGLTLVGKIKDLNLPYTVLKNKHVIAQEFINIMNAYNASQPCIYN